MKKIKYPGLILCFFSLFLLFSVSFGELSKSAYSFSSLLSNSDCIAQGTVNNVSIEPNKYHIIFNIEHYIKGRQHDTSIEIIVPLSNGLYFSDQPYLDKSKSYLLFLQYNMNAWTITNRMGGVFRADQKTDVILIHQAYGTNENLFSAQYSSKLKNMFFSVTHDDSKTRLLYDLGECISSQDVTFLSTLLQTDNVMHKIFSIKYCGRLQIESLRTNIEHLLRNSQDYLIIFHSIVSLGDYGNSESLSLILEYLSDSDPSIRRAAVHAAGKIGTNEIVEPLRGLYPSESDMGQRLTIIEAIARVSDLAVMSDALGYFLSFETNPLLISILERNLSP